MNAKLSWVSLLVLVLTGCECGPASACRADADCGAGLRCELAGGERGYCVVAPFDAGGPEEDAGVDAGVDAGSPLASIAATPIDFGAVPCGRAPIARELAIANTGSAPLTFATALTGPATFSVSGASTGTVAPGETFNLQLTAAVPSSSAAGAQQQAVLRVTTNDPLLAAVEVPLRLTASGVTLALTPGIASFGLAPLNSAAPAAPLSLTNLGNVSATVTVGTPADTQFTVTPGTLTVGPGETSSGLEGHFLPTRTAPSSSAAVLTVAEAVCGLSVGTIPLTGQGTSGSVGISTSDVFFGSGGRVACGTQAADKTLTLTNAGNQAFSWTGTLAKGTASPFTVTPSSGTVPASGGSVTLTIAAQPVPAQATTAEEAFGDTFSIVTDAANDSSHPIRLHLTASGAVLSFSPTSIDFGGVPVDGQASAPLSVVNAGNAPASVTLTSDNGHFASSATGPLTVGGGSEGATTAVFSAGSSPSVESGTLSLGVDGGDVLCAPLPSPVTLSGTATNGSVSYTPVALDFGQVSCGTTAPAQTVTFTNPGNQAYVVTPALAKGTNSAFTVAMNPGNGVVAQDGGTVVITVTPKAVPQTSAVTPNLYGDSLTVTTDVSGDTAHTIALRETAVGSIFAISANSLSFGSVAVGVSASSQFTLSNSGNAQGTLTFAPVQPTIFSLPSAVVLSAGASSAESGGFTPMSAMAYSDMAGVGVGAGTVLCQPLPFTVMSLSGTGSAGNVVTLSASSLSFGSGGLVPCGTTATAKTFTLTNSSSQTLAFTFTLREGTTRFTVTGPATLAQGTSGTVTVTPKAIPATASVQTDAFGDALTVAASGGPVNETHVVTLRQTAQGAILTFNPTALSFNADGPLPFSVENNGNLAAAYTLTLGGPQAGDYLVSPTSGTAPAAAAAAGSVASTATFSRPLLTFGTRSATVSLSSSAVRCAPLPAALTLTAP